VPVLKDWLGKLSAATETDNFQQLKMVCEDIKRDLQAIISKNTAYTAVVLDVSEGRTPEEGVAILKLKYFNNINAVKLAKTLIECHPACFIHLIEGFDVKHKFDNLKLIIDGVEATDSSSVPNFDNWATERLRYRANVE